MTKTEYETKPKTPEQGPKIKKPLDECALCHSTNVVVRVYRNVKLITCLRTGCGYTSKYVEGKLV